jgi:ATP-dependent helicase/DNAse subunit B
MRLIVGRAGSGKTAAVLSEFREAARAGGTNVRLLAPTATLVQHWQNQLAREGVVLRPQLIQTLAGFVRGWCGETEQAPASLVYLLVEDAVRRLKPAGFARMAGPQGVLPGFCASLARTVEEFASAGCRASRLKTTLPDAPLAEAFLAIYQEVERQLENRGLALRAWRLEHAAERIASEGTGGIEAVWLDGFHALPDPELRVIEALGRHAQLTLTAGETELTGELRARLLAMGFHEERAARPRPSPARVLVKAAGMEREAEEIARRILQQADAGRPFHEMGIIVRSADTYVPLLRTTLERFGIPARFYFDQPMEEHPVARFLTGAVDAMLGGWEHAATLKILRLTPRFADSDTMDRLDFKVREQLPSSGLGALKELLIESYAEQLQPLVDHLSALEEWRSMELAPKDWAAQMAELRRLFRPDIGQWRELPAGHARAADWRSQAEALDAFDEALAEAALAMEAHPIPLELFWRAVKAVLRMKVLRLTDGRRNVVHVLSAHEARQWVLPVAFVCGMVERQFPQFHTADAFFPETARLRLNQSGIRVRTAAEFEREEESLFQSAVSRATSVTVLSYPEFDARGERNFRSVFVDDPGLADERTHAVRPQPARQPVPMQRGPIREPALLEAVRNRKPHFSPTGLETYLQCAFQYFGRYTLRLSTAPLTPDQRLDFLTQGNIVHQVLKEWYAEPGDIAAVFARVFSGTIEEKRIPRTYQTERLRNTMLDDLQAFAADDRWARQGWQTELEKDFTFTLEEGIDIKGKIDRLEIGDDGRAYVIDYKYSNAQNTRDRQRNELLLQAPLYLMAAERCFGAKPDGMFYIGLKGGVVYSGWSEAGMLDGDPMPERWLETAAERTRAAVAAIRAGNVEASPADPGKCRWCDCRDVCRVVAREARAVAEGA